MDAATDEVHSTAANPEASTPRHPPRPTKLTRRGSESLTCFVETQRCYVASMALAGHMSMRPYQHIVIQISANSQIDSDPCYITVSNIDIRCASLARRSCRALAPCPPKRAAAKGSAALVLTCTCDTSPTEAWGDAACDVPVTQLENGTKVTSVQAKGWWSFYVLKAPEGSIMLPVLTPSSSSSTGTMAFPPAAWRQWADGLLLEFTNMMMGHPVLILKRGDYPEMLNNDYILTSSRAIGRKGFKLEAAHLGEVGFVFGIFNMDYY
eukprot:jgi/Tetstr1/457418/TSEL_004204.t1